MQTTDKQKALFRRSNAQGYDHLLSADDIGGRFSVLTG